MSLSIRWTNQFKKDYKKVQKSGLDINNLKDVIKQLSEQTPLLNLKLRQNIIYIGLAKVVIIVCLNNFSVVFFIFDNLI